MHHTEHFYLQENYSPYLFGHLVYKIFPNYSFITIWPDFCKILVPKPFNFFFYSLLEAVGNRHATDYHFTTLCRTISAGQTSPPPAGNLHSNYTNWIVCFSFTMIHNSKLTPIFYDFQNIQNSYFLPTQIFDATLFTRQNLHKSIALGLIYHLALVSVWNSGN